MSPLRLVRRLLLATERAPTEASLVRATFGALVEPLGVLRVVLRTADGTALSVDDADADAHVVTARSGSRRSGLHGGGRRDELYLAAGEATLVIELPKGVDPALGRLEVVEALEAVLSASLARIQLLSRVAEVSRRAHAEERTARDELARRETPGVVAESPAMRRLFEESIPLAARAPFPVLLLGETGVGKEVAARRIHALSARAHRPFVALSCGALPETLIDDALFGHERGAFTGATERRAGAFERADRGTLFLDEVGELGKGAQTRLLRALQEGEIRRLGGERELRVDVRIVAATNRDLASEVEAGTFRRDLFHRLAVVPLQIPPLRERPEDLPELVRSIVERRARELGVAPPRIGTGVLRTLRSMQFPGNVRELENLLARSMVLSPGEDLVLDARSVAAAPTGGLDAALRSVLSGALRESGGRIYGKGGAAERLGIPPSTLQSKLARLGITR